MFPRLKQRLGTAALGRLDVLVELSTLGAYGLAEDGRPLALDADQTPGGGQMADVDTALEPGQRLGAAPLVPRARDACSLYGAPSPRRCVPPARS
jgi:hypothetical protein